MIIFLLMLTRCLLNIIGIPRERYVGKCASELGFNYMGNLNYISDIIDENCYKELEVPFPASGKNSRCIVYSPEKDEVVALFVDITETQLAHRALDRNEKLFRNIFTNIPVGIEIYDQNGFMIDINNKDMDIFGVREKKDVLGVNVYQNPNVPEDVKERMQYEESLDFGMNYPFSGIEGYYDSKKKGYIALYSKVSRLCDGAGNFLGHIFLNIDNTERLDAINKIQDFENFFSFDFRLCEGRICQT